VLLKGLKTRQIKINGSVYCYTNPNANPRVDLHGLLGQVPQHVRYPPIALSSASMRMRNESIWSAVYELCVVIDTNRHYSIDCLSSLYKSFPTLHRLLIYSINFGDQVVAEAGTIVKRLAKDQKWRQLFNNAEDSGCVYHFVLARIFWPTPRIDST
jgi:hypothetical protein